MYLDIQLVTEIFDFWVKQWDNNVNKQAFFESQLVLQINVIACCKADFILYNGLNSSIFDVFSPLSDMFLQWSEQMAIFVSVKKK